jgi:uncharacterized protein (TIGR03435 family)
MVLSEVFFDVLACVAALETDIENGMQSTRAIHARSSICFYFTARRQPRTLMFANLKAMRAKLIAIALAAGIGIAQEQDVAPRPKFAWRPSNATLVAHVVWLSVFTGTFDVHVEWTADQSTPGLTAPGLPPAAPEAADPNGKSIFTVLQEQLGLKLESAKAHVEFLVIDRLERPSEN